MKTKITVVIIFAVMMVAVGLLIRRTHHLAEQNRRVRDRLHSTVLAITSTNATPESLTSEAYINHVLEMNSMFGNERVSFYGASFFAGEGEEGLDTVKLVERRFAPLQQSLEASMVISYENKLYHVKNGQLIKGVPQ